MGNLCPKVSESYSPVEIVDGLFVSEGINHSVLSKLGIRRVLIIGGECNAPGVCLTVSLNDQVPSPISVHSHRLLLRGFMYLCSLTW
jgi:hypothetical protein